MLMSALKITKAAPPLERAMAESRIRNGQIATLLSEIDAGVYDREQAVALIYDLVTRAREPSIWTEIRGIFRR
jgi:hypothetical protein